MNRVRLQRIRQQVYKEEVSCIKQITLKDLSQVELIEASVSGETVRYFREGMWRTMYLMSPLIILICHMGERDSEYVCALTNKRALTKCLVRFSRAECSIVVFFFGMLWFLLLDRRRR